MNQSTIEVIKLISSITTPIIILIFGFIITRKKESFKIEIGKKKEWELKWSDVFFNAFNGLNSTFEDIFCTLFELSEMNKRGETNTQVSIKKQEHVNSLILELKRNQFSLENKLCFSPRSSNDVKNTLEELLNLTVNTLKDKKGNFDSLKSKLVELNQKAMIAHKEMLNINK